MRFVSLAGVFAAAFAVASLFAHPAPTTVQAEGEVLYVALGDSITQGIPVPQQPGLTGYAWVYKDYLATDLGAPVTFINYGASGSPSLGLLLALNTDAQVQADVAAADVITFTTGTNDIWKARDDYVGGTCDLACMWQREEEFEANWDAILLRLKELNPAPETTFRTVDIYNPYIDPDQLSGALAVWQPVLEEANRHMCETAVAAGMPLVRAYDAFNGLSGTEDPETKGYLYLKHPRLNASTIVADEMRAFDQEAQPWDTDGDCLLNSRDNCPIDANAQQDNNDRNYIDLPPTRPFDDKTLINSDTVGDICDPDDDNDGIPDATETAGPPCASASSATSPLVLDTDGDRYADGAECAIGKNPADASSKPTQAECVTAVGAASTMTDTDGDGVRDYVEFCRFNSSHTSPNTDGDSCRDGKEIASLDLNATVNANDLALTASEFGSGHPNMDVDKNGAVNAADLGLVAVNFGNCP